MTAQARLLPFVSVLIGLATISGCSIYKAATLPEHRNLMVLSTGTPRLHVIAELGIPASTQTENGCKRDLFVFSQGPPPAVKSGRVVFHTAADVLTAGLWEIAGTPIEFLAEGKEMSIEVTYDEHDRVETIVHLPHHPPTPSLAPPSAPAVSEPAYSEFHGSGTARLEGGPSLGEPVSSRPVTDSADSVIDANPAK